MIRNPVFVESVLIGMLLVFSHTDSEGMSLGAVIIFAGLFMRWDELRDHRRKVTKVSGLKKIMFLRHPFELAGMMILFGFGIVSSAPYILAVCFVLLSFYHKMRLRPLVGQWSSEEIRQFGQWQSRLPASSPGFLRSPQGFQVQREHSEVLVRRFYQHRQRRELLIFPVFLSLFWLKSLLRYDFWTNF